METNRNLNSDTISLLSSVRRTDGIATEADIRRKPQAICIFGIFICGLVSIIFGGIGYTLKEADDRIAVNVGLNIWTGAIVSYNSLLYNTTCRYF